MKDADKSVDYVIAKELLKDESSKLPYRTETVVALMKQSHLSNSSPAQKESTITTVIVDEVHNGSAQSDYVPALTLAAMQKSSKLRLVLMSATGDHSLAEERIPYCKKLVMKGVMHCVRRYFLSQPIDHGDSLLLQVYSISRIPARSLCLETTTCAIRQDGSSNSSNRFMLFVPGVPQIRQLHEFYMKSLGVPSILAGHGDSSP